MGFLVLQDGTAFEGRIFGSKKTVMGEVVFHTGMTGYQELLTDPSYFGQVVVMTYPLIGNYGVNNEDVESKRPFLKGFVVRELCRTPNNWKKEESLMDYLIENEITCIEGIDTRALTRKIRKVGSMPCMICEAYPSQAELKALASYQTVDPIMDVTCAEKYEAAGQGEEFSVAVLDLGVKQSLILALQNAVKNITVFPANTTAEEILAGGFDGVFLTNGPGNPAENPVFISRIKQLADAGMPIFAVCLGHQLLALSQGAKVEKLPYGHRGGNHPVREIESGRVLITAQNHSYTVKRDSLPAGVSVSYENINDGTVEGLRYEGRPFVSVQFQPEVTSGAEDIRRFMARFIDLMKERGGKQNA